MSLFAEIALVLVAAVGVAVSIASLPTGPRSRWKRLAPPPSPQPDQLIRLERIVSGAGSSSLDVHVYLRPLLVEIASRRLAGRGQALERMPDSKGRDLLGDRLWEIVAPARPFPRDRYGPGLPPEELQEMLNMLRRL